MVKLIEPCFRSRNHCSLLARRLLRKSAPLVEGITIISSPLVGDNAIARRQLPRHVPRSAQTSSSSLAASTGLRRLSIAPSRFSGATNETWLCLDAFFPLTGLACARRLARQRLRL